MLFNIKELHIEISSKCTLKCPRCPRTELNLDYLNREISVEEFQTAFNPALLSEVERIIFCGDVGDPIYARDFLPVVEYVKSNSKTRLHIVTNGSYKDQDWWQRLGQLLDDRDQVTFSVDGWDQASNEQYRVNSNWKSIVNGAQTLRQCSPVRMNWSAIYFKFNEDHMQQIEQTARELGFDTFETVRSSKFDGQYAVNGVDILKPLQVAQTSQYERSKITFHRAPVAPVNKPNPQQHAWARCLNHQKELFVNVDGLVFPCPWFNNGYQTNDFVQRNKHKLTVKTRSLKEVLADPVWQELVDSFDRNPQEVCKIKCKHAQQ